MSLLKDNSKHSVFFYYLLTFTIIVIIYLQYDRSELKNEIIYKQALLNNLTKDSDLRAKLEGKELYKLLDIPKENIFPILKTTGKQYSIFIIVDSIDCYTCFKFHVDNINDLSNKNISIISYSNLHSDYLSKSLHESIIFPFKEGYKHKIINNSNMVILLINNECKIIYADIADKTNYEKSKIFYNKIKNFITM